jgi:hypothetical protein
MSSCVIYLHSFQLLPKLYLQTVFLLTYLYSIMDCIYQTPYQDILVIFCYSEVTFSRCIILYAQKDVWPVAKYRGESKIISSSKILKKLFNVR